MSSDFTIVISKNQHFGDNPNSLYGNFTGESHEYNFDCPGIEPGKESVWNAEIVEVSQKAKITINGQSVHSPDWGTTTRRMDCSIIKGGVLKEKENILFIEAVDKDGKTRKEGSNLPLDDFVIDNVVIFYKLK